MAAAHQRFRILAYTVGTGLVLLVFVAMPLKYFAHSPGMVQVVGALHGFLYMVYLVAALDMALRLRWNPLKTLLLLLAGTVPFMSFYAESKVAEALQSRAVRAG